MKRSSSCSTSQKKQLPKTNYSDVPCFFFLLLNLNKNIQKDTNYVIKVVTTQFNRYSTVASSTVHETAQPPPPQTAAPRVPAGVPPTNFICHLTAGLKSGSSRQSTARMANKAYDHLNSLLALSLLLNIFSCVIVEIVRPYWHI